MESSKNTIQLVEFSHHDLGWHKMGFREEADFVEYEINLALDIMNRDEKYKFCWTQEYSIYIYQYLMNHGERYEELKKRVLEGRFEIGTGYTSPYTAFITAELLARQMIYGKRWIEKMFPGYVSEVYYNTDVPALTKQLPQILVKSGTKYLYLSRSWNFDNFKQNEFLKWYSPDGTGIWTHFMHHYGDNVWEEKTVSYVEKRVPDYNYNFPILLIAMDCTPPNDLEKLMEDWEKYRSDDKNKEKKLPSLTYNTYQKAVKNIFEHNEFQGILKGEWPNKWLYENDGSDYNCFLNQKEAQRKLSMAEMLGVIYAAHKHSFAEYESGLFEKAWRYAEHACHGFAPEKPIAEFRRRYRIAHKLADQLLNQYATLLADGITAGAEGIPICVFHMGQKSCNGLVRVELPKSLQKEDAIKASLSDGTVCDSQKTADGKLLIRMQLPPAGFQTVYLESIVEGTQKQNKELGVVFENDFYEMKLGDCGIERLYDKENKKEVFQNGKFHAGELLVMNYDGMGAGEHLNIWQPDSKHYKCVFRNHPLNWQVVSDGTVCRVYQAECKAQEANIILTITAYYKIKKIDFDVAIKNLTIEDKKQLRIMFPMHEGKTVYEIPFGETTVGEDEVLKKFGKFNPNNGNFNDTNHDDNTGVRPREVQNYISCIDRDGFETMITSYNVPWDYQDPTEHPLRTPVLQPVLLSTSKACHWLYGYWSQNDDRQYHFSIMSDSGHHEELCARALEENGTVWSRESAANGTLFNSDTYSFLHLDSSKIQVTAVKKAEDDQKSYIIRMYNRTENKAEANVVLTEQYLKCDETDMIERKISEIMTSAEKKEIPVELKGCEIKNYQIYLAGMQDSEKAPEGLIAAIDRIEGEEKHAVTLKWIHEGYADTYSVFVKESEKEQWKKVTESTKNEAEFMLPDGTYEIAVKGKGSVMSCPIDVLIREEPKIELPEA